MINKIKRAMTALLVLPMLLLGACQSEQDSLLSAQLELTSLLDTVKDKASADAAADEIGDLMNKIAQLKDKSKSMTPEQKKQFETARAKAQGVKMGLGIRNYFGSTKLKDAMLNVKIN